MEKNEMIATRLADLGYDIDTFTEEKASHEADCSGNPAVYCGTYAKYNNGNLFGQWIDLTTFSDYDEFCDYCYALHADEADPELMFQDYENFPSEFYGECLGEEKFNKIQQYVEMCEKHDQDAVDAYISLGHDLENFEDDYCGEYRSKEDFAEEIVGDCYDIDKLPPFISRHIDWEGVARELFYSDYEFENGYVFRY